MLGLAIGAVAWVILGVILLFLIGERFDTQLVDF